jgi:hypothetical protein
MLLKIKYPKKAWKTLVKDYPGLSKLSLDKVFKNQCIVPFYKSPKKICSGEDVKDSTLGCIKSIKTSFFSSCYTITLDINAGPVQGKVIKTNITKKDARVIFEVYYNKYRNKGHIAYFAVVDNDNKNAESVVRELNY